MEKDNEKKVGAEKKKVTAATTNGQKKSKKVTNEKLSTPKDKTEEVAVKKQPAKETKTENVDKTNQKVAVDKAVDKSKKVEAVENVVEKAEVRKKNKQTKAKKAETTPNKATDLKSKLPDDQATEVKTVNKKAIVPVKQEALKDEQGVSIAPDKPQFIKNEPEAIAAFLRKHPIDDTSPIAPLAQGTREKETQSKSKKKLIIIFSVIVLLVAAVGGGGTYYYANERYKKLRKLYGEYIVLFESADKDSFSIIELAEEKIIVDKMKATFEAKDIDGLVAIQAEYDAFISLVDARIEKEKIENAEREKEEAKNKENEQMNSSARRWTYRADNGYSYTARVLSYDGQKIAKASDKGEIAHVNDANFKLDASKYNPQKDYVIPVSILYSSANYLTSFHLPTGVNVCVNGLGFSQEAIVIHNYEAAPSIKTLSLGNGDDWVSFEGTAPNITDREVTSNLFIVIKDYYSEQYPEGNSELLNSVYLQVPKKMSSFENRSIEYTRQDDNPSTGITLSGQQIF